mgnify:CR=1 FL=1
MLIDWFTVVAQIVNFLILVGLLKYFLYDRVIRAMEEREKRVRGRLEDAEKNKEEARRELEEYRRKNREIEEKRNEVFSEAKSEGDKKREELIRQAKEEADELRKRWEESVRREKDSFVRDLRQMAAREVYAIAARAFKDLGDADLEEQLVEVFLGRVGQLEEEKRKELAEAIEKEGNSVTVRTHFPMSAPLKRKVTAALRDEFLEDLDVRYETLPDRAPGIVLWAAGRKLAWSFDEYLDELEEEAGNALDVGSDDRPKKEEGADDEGKQGGQTLEDEGSSDAGEHES